MATQVSKIYTDITDRLLENASLATLGIMTDADFFNMLKDVLQDFITRTGPYKRLVNLVTLFGLSTYAEPDNTIDVQVVHFDNRHLARSSGFYLDNYNSQWQATQGSPERWREDEIPPKQVQLDPTPVSEGRQVTATAGNPGYGQIAACSNTNDFAVISEVSGYGTFQSFYGALPANTTSCYVNALNAGYGTVSILTASTTNLQLVSTVQPLVFPRSLSDYLQFVPDSSVAYITYGLLAKIFSGDTEYKDPTRAQYCLQRYNEGINLFAAIMEEVGVGAQQQ